MLPPALAIIFTFLACVGGGVIGLKVYRWIRAKLGGIQIIRVHVDVPVNRATKHNVDDMVLHDEIIGDPENQIGEYE
jgi:hypothetical protein